VATVDGELNSVVMASDYRVDDVEKMWKLIAQRRPHLSKVARHLVVYSSLWEPGRVLVTIGIRHRQSVAQLLRSPATFEWFDLAGVEDLPAIFVGKPVEKIATGEQEAVDGVPGVVVGLFASVADVAALVGRLRDGRNRLKDAGVRKIWVYRALDDGHEVMILQELEDEATARRWIAHPDAAAEWMLRADLRGYPAMFVGTVAHVLAIEPQ
jgi:hypothetical protein